MLTGPSDFIEQWARCAPHRVALRDVCDGRAVRYGELSTRAWRLTHALGAQGVGPGDRVALLARNGIETFELVVACLRLGAAFTPLNWRLAPAELSDIVDHCSPRCLVYDGASVEAAAALLGARPDLRGVALGERARGADAAYEGLLSRASADSDPVAHSAETTAMLLYTSGTTGKPKGVMVPHRQLFWNAINTVYACDLDPSDVALAFLPLFHTGGLNCLATPTLYRGGTVALMPTFDAARALEIIERWRVTATVAVPTMYQMLLDAGLDRHDCRSLKTILCGGASCPEPLLDAWLARGFAFRQGFGMTEVGPNCFSLPPWMVRRKRGSVGQPILHLAARVVDDDDRPVATGQVGELCLSGPMVCAGYWADPESSEKALKNGWFHTGDYARRDADDYYYVAGRKKDMFISGGENVYPAEIENVLLAREDVAAVAVVGVPHARWGEVGLAALVPAPGVAIDVDALSAWCGERLARFKVPRHFAIYEALPTNASGKVLKALLRQGFTGG
mgnify:CR=1 FL=1